MFNTVSSPSLEDVSTGTPGATRAADTLEVGGVKHVAHFYHVKVPC